MEGCGAPGVVHLGRHTPPTSGFNMLAEHLIAAPSASLRSRSANRIYAAGLTGPCDAGSFPRRRNSPSYSSAAAMEPRIGPIQ